MYVRVGSVQRAAHSINNTNLRSVALSFCSTVGSFPLDAKLVRHAQSCAQTNYLINLETYTRIKKKVLEDLDLNSTLKDGDYLRKL
ncbi:hypothetical protein VNO80_03953 [Phaseolus coccineus]|uniref:Uncharacterized protein n=1 Tax=Phaseolus coccineus TaxID=3886 RepID=A0AAN9NSR1_PHACN